MRGSTLGQVLDKLRAEAGLSLNPAQNRQSRDVHINLLQRHYQTLWYDYDWEHLLAHRYIPLQAGSRFYTPPKDIRIDRIKAIAVYYGNELTPLRNGVTDADYSAFNSLLDVRSWPAEKWRIAENEQLEIWPCPSQNADPSAIAFAQETLNGVKPTSLEGLLRVTGIRNVKPFVADSDVCELDDDMLALAAAADVLMSTSPAEAKAKQAVAAGILQKLIGRMDKRQTRNLLGRRMYGRMPQGPVRVAYRSNT